MREAFYWGSFIIVAIQALLALYSPWAWWLVILWGPLFALGMLDVLQKKHTILRNFPIIGHFRYLLEMIRPEINQYFIESNSNGTPFSREQRSIVYQRAKKALSTLPFGTQKNVYEIGYEWLNHSMVPYHHEDYDYRVVIGGKDCKKPYNASILNISAMSYGALSKNAILSLNSGAEKGDFAHNTGEGGVTPYHLQKNGDLIWQLGTGYFGARTQDGKFSEEKFVQQIQKHLSIKMVEIKLSQGAKPGHGGILPAQKITSEIAAIRGVPQGKDIVSPSSHSTFSTPIELCQFIKKLRDLSEGLPIGIKLCVGRRVEFMSLCKAMIKTGIYPDYIAVDGGEGGTGAAPLEFSNHIGFPLKDGLIFVHNALVGFNLRKQIKIIACGKILTGFDIISRLAIGADLCYTARGMMMALGCIQALRCNSNECPVGVATQNESLVKGLDVTHKEERVFNYHLHTMQSVSEILGAMGLKSLDDLRPHHLMRRVDIHKVKSYEEMYQYLNDGDLINGSENLPHIFQVLLEHSSAESFTDSPDK